MMRLILLDNYDSFTYNLADYFRQEKAEITVIRNDKATVEQILSGNFDGLVISPGPGTPATSGILKPLLEQWPTDKPAWGICLGYQAMGEHFGARLVKAPVPMHGKVSLVDHNGKGVFSHLENPVQVCRYHSLILTDFPESLEITSQTGEGIPMSLKHRNYPWEGVQFHPEAILTVRGKQMVRNWLSQF